MDMTRHIAGQLTDCLPTWRRGWGDGRRGEIAGPQRWCRRSRETAPRGRKRRHNTAVRTGRNNYTARTRGGGRWAVRRKPVQTTRVNEGDNGGWARKARRWARGDGRDDVHALSSGAVGSNVNICRGRATAQLPLISRGRSPTSRPARVTDGHPRPRFRGPTRSRLRTRAASDTKRGRTSTEHTYAALGPFIRDQSVYTA